MRTTLVLLLLAQSAMCQDGIPKSEYGYPNGFTAKASLSEIRSLQIEALERAQKAALERWASGLINVDLVVRLNQRLMEARLTKATDGTAKQEIAKQSIEEHHSVWARTAELSEVGAAGGNACDVAISKAALLLAMFKFQLPNPPNAKFNPLDDGEDLESALLTAWESAESAAQARYQAGLDSVDRILRIRQKRADSIAEITDDKLGAYELGLAASLELAFRAAELNRVGARGGSPFDVAIAKAEALKFRAAWIEAGGDPGASQPAPRFPFPEMSEVTDYETALKAASAAYGKALEDAARRYSSGLDTVSLLWSTRLDMLKIELQLAKTKPQRLDAIEACLKQAIQIWRRADELSELGAIGGGTLPVAVATAQVFDLRVAWLEEHSQ